MKRGPRPKRPKDIWYVSFEPKERLPGQRAFIRKTKHFETKARSTRINRSGSSRQASYMIGSMNKGH